MIKVLICFIFITNFALAENILNEQELNNYLKNVKCLVCQGQSVFDSNITPQNIVYDQMKFNSSISNIEFIDEDILAVVLKNGELWYTNIVTKDKVKLYPNEKRKVKVLNRIADEIAIINVKIK